MTITVTRNNINRDEITFSVYVSLSGPLPLNYVHCLVTVHATPPLEIILETRFHPWMQQSRDVKKKK